MKIYRFIPDAVSYRPLATWPGLRWWPEGIELGPEATASFPAAALGSPWPHAGNRYALAGDRARPVSDFPALQLNVLVMSERAHGALRHLRGLERVVPISVGDERFVVPQLPALGGALDLRRSAGLRTEEGDLLFVARHVFSEEQVTADAFWIDGAMPLSNVYLTGAFRDAALAAGLTGLERLELVHDGAPVVVRATPPAGRTALIGPRYELEDTLVTGRARVLGHPEAAIRPLIERAFLGGEIPVGYA